VTRETTPALPQLGRRPFITDGGIETDLMFHRGFVLPEFAAFVLLDDPRGRDALRAYYRDYLTLAREFDVGVVLDTPTWRASRDWGERLGYSPQRLAEINRNAVGLLEELRSEAPCTVVSGCVGPRADAGMPEERTPEERMTAAQTQAYHEPQVQALADGGADLITALTLADAKEAVGIARAAESAGIPVAISFTVEIDGRLPGGRSLPDAIAEVDAETGSGVAYFMINCAHPTHFAGVLTSGAPQIGRIRGLKANASASSHAELDESDALDEGDPLDLAERYGELIGQLPGLTVLGGCCGTDRRHHAAICEMRARRAG
jgi:S-methylmethionine-dependent homocysteine/selenocysteine methylase